MVFLHGGSRKGVDQNIGLHVYQWHMGQQWRQQPRHTVGRNGGYDTLMLSDHAPVQASLEVMQ